MLNYNKNYLLIYFFPLIIFSFLFIFIINIQFFYFILLTIILIIIFEIYIFLLLKYKKIKKTDFLKSSFLYISSLPLILILIYLKLQASIWVFFPSYWIIIYIFLESGMITYKRHKYRG
jgi:hypothetical protein